MRFVGPARAFGNAPPTSGRLYLTCKLKPAEANQLGLNVWNFQQSPTSSGIGHFFDGETGKDMV